MLTIAQLQAHYYLPEGLPDRQGARRRLDGLVRHRLQSELMDSLRLSNADREAVYRIRHLRIDLWIDRQMEDGEISSRWSQLILQSTVQALLRGAPADIVRYDDPAHFLAAFLGDVLAGRASSLWMYDEFAPLNDLPVGRVAAHLLAVRPALLVPMARRLARHHQLEPLLRRFTSADVRLVWEDGLGFRDLGEGIPDSGQVARVLVWLRDAAALERGGDDARARNALRLYLAMAMRQPERASDPALGMICRDLALLHHLWTARPVPALWSALAYHEVAPTSALSPMLEALAPELASAGDRLRTLVATRAGRAYLARLVPVVVPAGAKHTKAGSKNEGLTRRTSSEFAGLALLVPVMRDLGLHRSVSRAGLYQVLLNAVGREHEPLALSDPAAAWLAGLEETEQDKARIEPVDWPDVSPWIDGVGMDEYDEHDRSCRRVTLLVLRYFARGLRGFAQSSPGYLAEQFINMAGRLERSDKTVDVYLSRAPLGIILHVAGRDGEQGPIPWLGNCHLHIHLPEG